MEITWLGHSCFRLKGSQAVVITDPYPPDLGYTLGKQSADIVTVSHEHPDHNYVTGVSGDPHIVHSPGEYEIGGVLILGKTTYHDDTGGSQRGKNTIYLMDIDGIAILHLGDLGNLLATEQREDIGSVDVLLLPVGGVTTIDATMAAEIIRGLEPQIIIPMHYRTPLLKRELDPVDRFLKEMGREQVEPRPKLNVSRSNLPPTPQVVVLNYPGSVPG